VTRKGYLTWTRRVACWIATALLLSACRHVIAPPLQVGQLPAGEFCGEFLPADFDRLPDAHRSATATLWLAASDHLQPAWSVFDVSSPTTWNCGGMNQVFGYNACDPPQVSDQSSFCRTLPTCMQASSPTTATPNPPVAGFVPPTITGTMAVFQCAMATGPCTLAMLPASQSAPAAPAQFDWTQGCRVGGNFVPGPNGPAAVAVPPGNTRLLLAAVYGSSFGPSAPDATRGEQTGGTLFVQVFPSQMPMVAPERRQLTPNCSPGTPACTEYDFLTEMDTTLWDEDYSSSLRVAKVRVFEGQAGTVDKKYCHVKVLGSPVSDQFIKCQTTGNARDCWAELPDAPDNDVTPAYSYTSAGTFRETIGWNIYFDDPIMCPAPPTSSDLYLEFELALRHRP
jgi:hypothetical protein